MRLLFIIILFLTSSCSSHTSKLTNGFVKKEYEISYKTKRKPSPSEIGRPSIVWVTSRKYKNDLNHVIRVWFNYPATPVDYAFEVQFSATKDFKIVWEFDRYFVPNVGREMSGGWVEFPIYKMIPFNRKVYVRIVVVRDCKLYSVSNVKHFEYVRNKTRIRKN